jgi:hypothetical protein
MIKAKSSSELKYFFIVGLLPVTIAGFLNAIYAEGIWMPEGWGFNFFKWAGTNLILLTTFGFIVILFISKQNFAYLAQSEINNECNMQIIKFSTFSFYISIIVWNSLFLFMFLEHWIDIKTIIYIFPWLVGNIFFLSSLFLSKKNETDKKDKEAFDFYEKRSVVAETNTQMLILAISFLLPTSITIMTKGDKDINPNIITIFVFNITTAIASIGLIWVPYGDVKLMLLIKTLKTIFHLFTLSLLLLGTIMIMNTV